MQRLRLEGRGVYLAEVEERYFPAIITWRNDVENNRYLNQPFLLDMEKQRAWYRRYCSDPTQGLLVVVDKQNDTPFATMGWTDHDPAAHLCITGRLLVGDRRYRGSLLFAEASMLFADYMYGAFGVDVCYAHVACGNAASIRYHEKYGFHRQEGQAHFPHELRVNGMVQAEYMRTRADWQRVRNTVEERVRCVQGEVQR